MYYTFKKRINNPDTQQLSLFTNPIEPQDYKELILTVDLQHFSENQIQKASEKENMFLNAAPHVLALFQAPVTETMQEYYTTFRIPKKTHGFRKINAPIATLKETQTYIAHLLTNIGLLTHDTAFAYVPKRNHYSAIKKHQANQSHWFLKLDIKDFFPNCTKELVLQKLKNLYPICLWQEGTLTVLEQLIHLCCLNGVLPQGSPASPLLSNLLFIEYDYKITEFLKHPSAPIPKQKYIYTRYADDICISSITKFDWQTLTNSIQNNILGADFTLKQEKTRYGSTAGRNWNLGLMLNKDNKITTGATNKRNLKAMLCNFVIAEKNNTPYTVPEIQRLLGLINYAKQIEPDYITFLINKYSTKYNLNIMETILYRLK